MKRAALALMFILVGVLLSVAALFLLSKSVTLDTRMELVTCGISMQEYRLATGKWPANPGQIDERTSTELGLAKGTRIDEWGRPFLLKIEPDLDQATLQTHGKDGKPGTQDGDLRVVVTTKQLTVSAE